MNSVEAVSRKIQMLPLALQKVALDFIDDLLEKSAKDNQEGKAAAWEDWANSHSQNHATVDDSRDKIYEDE